MVIESGDIAIHQQKGFKGEVVNIETESCLRPIHVCFKFVHPHNGEEYAIHDWYDETGEADGPENTIKFYRDITKTK